MTTTDTLDLAAIRRAISDPGAVLPRDLGDGFQSAESVSNWSARAVLAVLAPKVEEMQAEIERLRQKDRDAMVWEARLAGHAWTAADNTHALAEQNEQLRGKLAAQAVAEWNETHPVGTPVTYWPGVREGNGKASRTRTPAQVLNGHTAVVWVDGCSSCIALTHVEPEPEPIQARHLSCQGLQRLDPTMPIYQGTVPVVGVAEEIARRGEGHVYGCELIGHIPD